MPLNMDRTFHPVGHGAFYTERFFDGENHDHPCFNVVYDCGTSTSQKALRREIDNLFNNGDRIDLLFISHFHDDHINGIDYLVNTRQCDIRRYVIPEILADNLIEAYLYNFIKSRVVQCYANIFLRECYNGELDDRLIVVNSFEDVGDERDRTFETQVIDQLPNEKIKMNVPTKIRKWDWLYIPYNHSNRRTQLIEAIRQSPDFQGVISADGRVNIDNLSNRLNALGLDRCKEIYRQIFGSNHNIYSMPVFSGTENDLLPTCCQNGSIPNTCNWNCLYLGDKKVGAKSFKSLQAFYRTYWGCTGVLQVPHHGSKGYSYSKLYDPKKICIVSCKSNSARYPNSYVIKDIIYNRSILYKVTEEVNTKVEFIYTDIL